MNICSFLLDDMSEWDDFVRNDSLNGTIFHEQSFLLYHKDRFHDKSLLIREKGRIVACFPAALIDGEIVSHPGSTYGGVIIARGMKLHQIHETTDAIIEYYKNNIEGLKSIKLVLAENFHTRAMSDGIIFSLWQHGFRLISKEISTVITIDKFLAFTDMRKTTRQYLKSEKYKRIGICYSKAFDKLDIRKAYDLISDNLEKKYSKKPAHSWNELSDLLLRYPDRISIFVAKNDSDVVATYIIFELNDQVAHVFYIARNEDRLNVADIGLVQFIVSYYNQKSFLFVNFGISSRADEIKWWIHNYKEQFSKDFLTRDTWLLPC